MSDNPLTALAMRERAAGTAAGEIAAFGYAEFSPFMRYKISALPTTFTYAELLAAAMQLPEVQALVDAIGYLVSGMARFDAEDYGSVQIATDAISPFMKGGDK